MGPYNARLLTTTRDDDLNFFRLHYHPQLQNWQLQNERFGIAAILFNGHS